MRQKVFLKVFSSIFSATLCVMILLIIIPLVTAVGVVPAKTDFDFTPNGEHAFTINIINNEHKDMAVLVYTEGPFGELLNLKPSRITLSSAESAKMLEFRLSLPAHLEKPGTQEIPIIIKEVPYEPEQEENTMVSATVEIVHKVNIKIPYPGKYIEADLIIDVDNPEMADDFTLPVFNRGDKDVKKISADIAIFDAFTDEKITTIETSTISLASGADGKLTANLAEPLPRGKFKAIANIEYDNKNLVIEKVFTSQIPTLDIISISVDRFSLGSIARFDIWVKNNWNQERKDVFADMIITDQKGAEKGRFKTATTGIEAEGLGQLEGYWDSSTTTVGKHTLKLILHYAGLIKDKTYNMNVDKKTLTIEGFEATGAVVGKDSGENSWTTVLVLSVIALLVMNILLLLTFSKRKRRKMKEGQMQQKTQQQIKQQTLSQQASQQASQQTSQQISQQEQQQKNEEAENTLLRDRNRNKPVGKGNSISPNSSEASSFEYWDTKR